MKALTHSSVLALSGLAIASGLAQAAPSSFASGEDFVEHGISMNADSARCVHSADIDGDGDMDVLSASSGSDGKIAWYENTGGAGAFVEHVISVNALGAWSVHSSDLDGDGDMDVLSASYWDDKIAWYENTDGAGTFVEHEISTSADGAESVHSADLDGDGDMDVLSASYYGDKIAWYENTDGAGTFVEHEISTSADSAASVYSADIDGDGDMDVLSASFGDNKIAWYENTDGAGTFAGHEISTNADGAISVHSADLDGDGDMDVLSASSLDNKIAWYENTDGAGTFVEHGISTSAGLASSVHSADIDGDGDMDILSASFGDNKIAWYENTDGAGTFAGHEISTDADGAQSVHSADIDGDGDVDVLSASMNDNKIAWYENQMSAAIFPEGFETAVPPSGWVSFIGANGLGPNHNWRVSSIDPPVSNSGAQAAYVRYENVSGGLAEDWLVTPQFTPEASASVLTFAQRQSYTTNYGTVYTVRVSTLSQSNHADFTTVDTQTEDDFTYYHTMREVDLSAYIGTPIYVAFVMENDDGDNWIVDDVDLIAGGGGAGPPSFTSGGDVTSSEDQGPVTISGWATDINENGGTGLNFVVTPGDASVFSVVPTVDATTGDLSFTTAANAYGSTSFDVALHSDQGSSSPVSVALTITPVNDPPVVSLVNASSAYQENGPAVSPLQGVTIEDVDDVLIERAVLTISNFDAPGGDVLTVTPPAGITHYTTNSGSAYTHTLDGSATLAEYMQVLGSITYANTGDDPTKFADTRVLTLTVEDADDASNLGVVTITISPVNDPPTISFTSLDPSFVEGGAAVALADSLTIADGDDTVIQEATVRIENLADFDVLSAQDVGSVTSSYNPGTGTLTLTGAGSIADYESTLESVTYMNGNGDDPVAGQRSISFVVNDGEANSDPWLAAVTVIAVNDPPVVSLPGGNSIYPEGGPAVSPLQGVTIEDVDDVLIESAVLTISNFDAPGGDVLTVTPPAGITHYTTNTGSAYTHTLAGSATLAEYMQVLGSITYANTGDDPTKFADTRVLTLTVEDADDASNLGVVTITVSPVNDPPSFVAGPDQQAFEDELPHHVPGWASQLDAVEAGQTLTFSVTTDNDSLFSVLPTVDGATGDLSYESAPDANGSATLSIYAMDSGGTSDGGDDTSATQTATITVTAVNDPPSFENSGGWWNDYGGEVYSGEDEGLYVRNGWALEISAGPSDESGQSLTFVVTTDNDGLFSQFPSVDSVTGDLSYVSAPDAHGEANLTITLVDDGGTENNGLDTSAAKMVQVTVSEVNDPPSFTAGPDQNIQEDDGPQLISGWATEISAGPPDEADQLLNFNVTPNDPSQFSQLPTVDAASGDLSYEFAPDMSGVAHLLVVLENGEDEWGDPHRVSSVLVVTVAEVNDAPSFTAGVDQGIREDEGMQVVQDWATGMSPGPGREGGFSTSTAETTLLSIGSSGEGTNSHSYVPAISDDGQLAVFKSYADNLVSDDTNDECDIFLHDLSTGAVTRLSKGLSGEEANGGSHFPRISGDGRFVVFTSQASNLVAGDTNSGEDVFRYELSSGITQRVSVNSAGDEAVDALDPGGVSSGYARISHDGRYVSFKSTATNLVEDDTNGETDIFWRDVEMGETRRVSISTEGEGANGRSDESGISADGRLVVFESYGDNLVVDDNNDKEDIFLHEIDTGTTTLVSRSSSGEIGDNYSSYPAISGDGRYVVFHSYASNLVPGDTNDAKDVFRKDLQTSEVMRVSVSVSGAQADAWSEEPTISGDGRYVAFESSATNLLEDGKLFFEGDQMFVRDCLTGELAHVSVSSVGHHADEGSEDNYISGDGRWAIFRCYADNIVPGDENGKSDIFLHGPLFEEVETPAQDLSFEVTTDNDGLFTQLPTVDGETGDLSYEAAPDANGVANLTVTLMDDGGTANDGVDTSDPQYAAITVTAVNDAPSFTAGPNVDALEDAGEQSIDAWATDLSKGPGDESGQTLSFDVTTDNDGLFIQHPAIHGVTGELTFESAPDVYGSATLSIYVMDDGGTENDGVDTSATQTVTITVTPVNDMPSFTAGPDETSLEDLGPQMVSAWATALSTGPANEADQSLTFFVSTDNDSLFSTLPTVDGVTGDLSYEAAPDEYGSATLSVYVMDDGGTDNDGVDTSATQTVTITITPVNDVPSFTGGANQEIWEDAGPQDVAWATAMSAGPANEAHQTLTFMIVNDNPALFSDSPAIDAMTGELTYTVADNEHGVANLEVRIQDDGGTADGGVDTSDPQALMITIHAVNDAPVMGLADGWSIASPDLHATGPYELFGSGVDDLDTRIGDGVESMAMVMEVALFADHGVLSLPSAGGVTFLMGDGVEDRLLRFEGELPELNAALSHIEYRPDQFFGGFDRVFGSIDDRGWYGDGGPLSDDDMTVVEVKVPLGSATEFDVFGIGEVELLRSSAHGRVAAGEELRLHMFQAADVPFGSEQDVLISGGSITASQGAVYNGNAVYGTDADIADSVGFFNSDHEPRQGLGVVDFAHAEGDLEYRSASWGLVSPTGTAVLENDILHLTGSGRELNIFSIDREDLEAASTVQLSTPPGAFALLNINGGAVDHSHFGVLISGVDERSVLMNFYEAESMVLYGTELAGSVLAPNAHVRVDALTVGGNLVADSVELVDGSAEGNRLAGEPWENTPWIMMLADEDGEDEPGYTFTFEPSSAEQDVTFQLTNNGELEVVAEGYPTLRYQTDRITRLVVLDREDMSHLEISEKLELPYELAGNGPVAYDDSASLDGEKSVVVDVLSNDLAGPAPLDLSSVEVTTEPRHGVVKIDRETGALIYQAGPHGPQVEHDELWYTVRDELSNVSTARRVRVQF